ncbi:Thoeris anti-defense Tad2 family protein [Thiohalorhabdus sp.]|uniref:Thoeris anti-defense Tad2 family protein n=1 Tax=Thiohalorhabdus sp. TaxID=3094134 RepID=UPI002FC2E70C
MNFGEALQAALLGKMVSRQGWSGMAVIYTPPMRADLPDEHHYQDALSGDTVVLGGHFDLVMPGDVIQPGWLPSANDLVADDWTVTEQVEGEPPEIKETDDEEPER